MAPSLQLLIDYVLNEVALCGNQGATLSFVLQAITAFYQSQSRDGTHQQNVDRRFQAKVWSWLTKNPEVSVGQKTEFNHLTLDEAEQLDSQAPEAEPNADQNHQSHLRIFVSSERTWFAITGHEPDESKVMPLELVLLSIIASRKSEGIVQPELVKLSGQDKRSVPTRTDKLQAKGYIDKRPVQIRGSRTSLCTLKRFLRSTANEGNGQSPEQSQAMAMIDFDAFNDKLFEILREHQIVTRNDLKRLLGFDDPWRWRILSRAIRKYERIGVLKRVRAKSQYEKLHPCIKLQREPTETDLKMFHEFKLDVLDNNGVRDLGDIDQDELDIAGKRELEADEGALNLIREHVEDVGRMVPSWNPERNTHNQMFDIIERTGTSGMTNQEVARALFGNFYRRPTENILQRLVDLWQMSQPLHLRHFAIVRDMAMQKTTMFYVHYAGHNFAKLVEAGQASWEAVEFPEKKAKSLKIDIPPFNEPSKSFLENPNATLRDGIVNANPSDYLLSTSDPFVVRLPDGRNVVRTRLDKLPPGSKLHMDVRPRSKGRPKGVLNKKTIAKLAKIAEAKGLAARESEVRESATEESPREESAAIETSAVDPAAPEPEHQSTSKKAPAPDDWKHAIPRKIRKSAARANEFQGMSRIEKLKALGMDESWTEYKVQLMDMPVPGVYITPHGRRRPTGKARGRPRKSRIAVFKSPKLAEFPWFVNDDLSDDEMQEDNTSARASESVSNENTASNTRWPTLNSPAPSSIPNTNDPESGRPSKRPRLGDTQGEIDQVSLETSEGTLPDNAARASTENMTAVTTPRHRDKSGGSVHPLEDEQNQTPSKRRRVGASNPSPNKDTATASSPVKPFEHFAPRGSPAYPQQSNTTRKGPRQHKNLLSTAEAQPPVAPPRPLIERGGSISFLRRKVILELMERAGGVFPTGAALWYPFVSEWMKARPKERPDMRTINTAVKVLVDAGQIRQLTFSGRDRKGVMVTRTLLMKSELSPEDARVKNLQSKMLATDVHEPRPIFSENVVLDPGLTRSGRRQTGEPPKQQKFRFPLETKATVTLHQKPAFAKAAEARRGRAIQKRLMRGLQAEADAFMLDEESERQYGVQRLMTIARPPVLDMNVHPLTSVIRPDRKSARKGSIRRLDTLINPKQRMRPISNISQYALLMAPVQEFHSTSGTFSTGSWLMKSKKAKRGVTAEQFVSKLTELADQSQISDTFNATADKIMKWEIDHENVFNSNLEGMQNINQTLQGEFETEPISGEIRFEIDMPRPSPLPVPTPMETRSITSRRLQTDDTFQLKRKKRRKPRPNRRLAALDEVATPDKDRPAPRQLVRRQTRSSIPEQLLRNIMIAITAVRVLTGGLDARVVEWNLVTRAFPEHDPSAMEQKARRCLNRNRLQIAKMQRDFQERYLEAYEKGLVPTIDYNDLENYDWPGVVEWASTHLDVPLSQSIPDLPATREQFDAVFELREEPLTASDEVYQSVHGSTINHKRALMARTPFAVPVIEKEQAGLTVRQKGVARLEDAKSWVRANIITSEETYKSAEAADVLNRIGEPLITDATQALVNDRVITMTNSGRILPGRNYDISDNFLQTLSRKRAVDSTQLVRAAQFKTTILDPQLQNLGIFDVKYNAEDGDILALINLATSGRVELRPSGAPRDKFGLTDGGYLTRQMDKTRLRFPVKVLPTESYVYGNPILEQTTSIPPPPPPPVSPYTDLGRRCPMWFDIHGELVPRLWTMAMGAVLGCMVLRPGVNARSISNMMKPTLAPWEVILLLRWLAEVGAVKGDGNDECAAWRLQEWWWMVVS
ncbi:uncharacterized protein N7446_006204 [Penicillium canescens]|uniref:uncharacterized protein n=1 Tax=Penicillium canescens TaxID=5083 RepID=UPI0026DF5411|nr:uncharacterized protein N7446_006204 [Penicillium canescens]KAJ6062084.1 hypothetical protein N7446_006204 [Penicillium canescens]